MGGLEPEDVWRPPSSSHFARREQPRSLFGGANANVNATGGFPCGALLVSSGASVVARCGGPPSGAQQDGPDGTAALCAVGIPVVFTKGSHLNVTSLGYTFYGAASFNQQLGGSWSDSTAVQHGMFGGGCPSSIA